MKRKRNEESLTKTQGCPLRGSGAICLAERYALRRDILPMAKRYAPNGAWVKTPHQPRAVPLSFSGDANPFVLADISPNRGIASKGKPMLYFSLHIIQDVLTYCIKIFIYIEV